MLGGGVVVGVCMLEPHGIGGGSVVSTAFWDYIRPHVERCIVGREEAPCW